MASLIGSCVGSLCAGCSCVALTSCCTHRTSRDSTLPYLLLLFTSTFMSLILNTFGRPLVVDLTVTTIDICSSEQCYGFQAVARISEATFIFFLLLTLFHYSTTLQRSLQTLPFGLQLILFICTLVLSWFTPPALLSLYVNVAKFLAALFLLIQLVVLIDFAYRWNDEWFERGKFKSIVVAAAIMLLLTLVTDGFIFGLFVPSTESCSLPLYTTIVSLLVTVFVVLLSVSNMVSGGGLLPSSAVCLYAAYVLFSAFASSPSETCNSHFNPLTVNSASHSTQQLLHQLLSLSLTAVSLCYAAWSIGTSPVSDGDGQHDRFSRMEESAFDRHESLVTTGTTETTVNQTPDFSSQHYDKELSEAEYQGMLKQRRRLFWCLALAAPYMLQLLTDWSTVITNQRDVDDQYSAAQFTFFIKLTTHFACLLLFCWTLIAPRLFPDRDFD